MTDRETSVVWIINHYTTIPSRDGAGARHFRLAQELGAHGWTGVLFLASTRHPSGQQAPQLAGSRWVGEDGGTQCVMLRTPPYAGGVSRVRNMASFALRLLNRRAVRGVPLPDVVVGSTVHLLAAWSALRLARRYGVPFVFEIRDIWPETLIDLGKLTHGSLPARLMTALSRHLCAQASLVISPLPGVRTYLDDLGLEETPFEWISNGVDVPPSLEHPGPTQNREFTLMYLGSHGHANGLSGLLDAFERACIDTQTPMRLRLVGDGTQKEALVRHAAGLECADRITFEERIPRNDVVKRAREADALIVNIEDLPVYRFGISLNKLFDYLAAGRPTIIATSAVNNPIADAGAGICVPAGDIAAMAVAIEKMSKLHPTDRDRMGRRGLEYVRTNFAYPVMAAGMKSALEALSKSPGGRERGGRL